MYIRTCRVLRLAREEKIIYLEYIRELRYRPAQIYNRVCPVMQG